MSPEKTVSKNKKQDRFVCTYTQGTMNVFEIWVDRFTGVNYLYRSSGYQGGLTVMLDSDGKPLVTPINENGGFFDE